MIVCPKCGKENQDHYKFCLGCGNELPRDSAGGRGFRSPTPTANPIPETGRGSAVPGGIPPASVASGPGPYGSPASALSPFAPASGPGPFAPAQPGPFGPPPQAAPFPSQPGPFAPPPQAAAFAPSSPGPFAPPPPQAAPIMQPQPFMGQLAPQPPPPPQAAFQAPQPPPAPQAQAPQSPALANSGPVSRPPATMPATCPQCSSANPRNNRFCITCGFDMATVPSSAPAAAADPMLDAPTPPVPNAPTVPQPQRVSVERARLVLIRPDGTEGGHHALLEGDSSIGRESGGVFSNDPFLSPKHASFAVGTGTVTVRDEGSLNGIYIRIERQQPVEINDGDVFRIGQEILRFEAFHPVARNTDGTERIGAEVEGLVGKIVLVTGRESFASAFPVPVTGLYLGRERGDILFPEDGYVSGLHCQLAVNQGRLTVTDVGSSNGSYVRLHGPRAVRNGDFLLLGQQLFRVQTL